MTKSCLLLLVTALMLCASAVGQDRGTGLGIILGEPTGLSVKLWLDGKAAIDGGIAWSFGKKDALHLHADYLFHNFDLFKVEKGRLPAYVGIGGRIKFEEDSRVGIRIPLGIVYIFDGVPLDAFLEVVPLLDLVPSTDFGSNGGIGIRYYF